MLNFSFVYKLLSYPLIKLLYFTLINRGIFRKKSWLDVGVEKKIKLEDTEKCEIQLPNFHNSREVIQVDIPEIYCYKLENIVAEIESSSFYDGKNIYVERFLGVNQKNCNYNTGQIILNFGDLYFIRKNKKIKFFDCNVLFLGGNGSSNYFHWIIEILPKLIFINQLKEIDVIVVHENVKKIKSYSDALDIFLKYFNINISVEYVAKNISIKCSNLYYISSFNHTVFNIKSDYEINYNRISHRKTKLISDIFFCEKRAVNINENLKFPKKFFIRRGRGISAYNKRNYNEMEISEAVLDFGIKSIYIEDYSFFEQMELFSNADLIVAPSGAFLTNIIFCNKNAKIISWLPESLNNYSLYSTLAAVFDVDMHFINSKLLCENNSLHSEYFLSKDALVNKIYEVYEY